MKEFHAYKTCGTVKSFLEYLNIMTTHIWGSSNNGYLDGTGCVCSTCLYVHVIIHFNVLRLIQVLTSSPAWLWAQTALCTAVKPSLFLKSKWAPPWTSALIPSTGRPDCTATESGVSDPQTGGGRQGGGKAKSTFCITAQHWAHV